ncbi:DUF6356 family protein [Thalassospiraceae bacterium LMO-JJ14]|nr:DUF6356 family protein [Thalassospiraceae bacterium LMO-JJ14]
MLEHFTRHPHSVGESYFEHMGMASGFAASMLLAAAVCAVHAVLPFVFEKTASRMIADLYQRTGPGRVRKPNSAQLSESV